MSKAAAVAHAARRTAVVVVVTVSTHVDIMMNSHLE
jgi:hypothetical protein